MFTQEELNLYIIPSEKAIKTLNKDKKGAVPVDDYGYARQIGDDIIVKVMYGKTGQEIK